MSMMKYGFVNILLFLMILFLAACQDQSASAILQGRILLWHSWPETETQVLDTLLDEFTTIHPQVQIIRSRVASDTLLDQFKVRADLGVGPDLLIGSSDWVVELAEADLIQDLSAQDFDPSIYLSTAIQTLRYQDKQYGWPLALQTTALYYNKEFVTEPPKSLTDLLRQVAEGISVGLNSSFEAAFWGIQSFGGQLFDAEGRVILDQGGFANWLSWLKNAHDLPNFILDRDQAKLYALFQEGKLAYYVDGPQVLSSLQATLGSDVVGVAPLPNGPYGPAGPFLRTEALMLNTASSARQTKTALRLARFLINSEQQRKLSRQANKIPVNLSVRLDTGVFPALTAFVAQSKTAVPKPALPQMTAVLRYGNETYIQALEGEGVVGLTQAALYLTQQVNAEAGFAPADVSEMAFCPLEGNLRVWHSWSELDSLSLTQLARTFTRRCPGVFIDTLSLNVDLLQEQYQDQAAQGFGPDLLLGPDEWLPQLAAAGLLRDVSDEIDTSLLQQFIPGAQQVMRYEDGLYGLPQALDLMALFYNTDLVDDPPRILDDLLYQATPIHQVALPINFYQAFWGIPAFGGRLFDEEYRLVLSEDDFGQWLIWLEMAQAQSGMLLSEDLTGLKNAFIRGEAAYLAGQAGLLAELQDVLGLERVRVVPLPAGPQGEAGSFFSVEGVMFNSNISDDKMDLALEFAKHITGVEGQTHLMQQANHVPSNINVDTSNHPAIAGFVQQMDTSVAVPHRPEMMLVWELGDRIYRDVLTGTLEPLAAVSGFTKLVNEANGFIVEAETVEDVCVDSGELIFWHSWDQAQATVLHQIAADFMARCSDLEIKVTFVAADTLVAQQRSTDTHDSRPHLFLVAHQQLRDLQARKLIQDIAPWVSAADLVPYSPNTVAALQEAEALYGLPMRLDVMALYYNRDLVAEPAQTLDQLLATDTLTQGVALDTSYYGAAWGVGAFGGSVLDADGNLILEANQADSQALEQWLAWLRHAQTKPKVILSPEQPLLRAAFAAGEVAYLVAGPDALTPMQTALGPERLGVTTLPAGPSDSARPFLEVDAFVFPPTLSEAQRQVALNFAIFATAKPSQAKLAAANIIPVNLALDLPPDSSLTGFINQAKTALLSPFGATSETFQMGDALYQLALNNRPN